MLLLSNFTTSDSLTNLVPENFLQDNLAIEGGHYIIQDGQERIGDVEIYTWEKAVRLYSHAVRQGLKGLGLILLVDDFGVNPSVRQDFHATYELPESYQLVLEQHNVDFEEISISWSTQLRNRATKDLRKMRVKGVEKSNYGYIARFPNGGYRILTEGSCPRCGSIVARHFKEKADRFGHNINLYSWVWNGSNENGLELAKLLYEINLKCYNFYYYIEPEVVCVSEIHT